VIKSIDVSLVAEIFADFLAYCA